MSRGPSEARLGPSCPLGAQAVTSGLLKVRPAYFDNFWQFLTIFDHFYHFWPFWTILDHFDHFDHFSPFGTIFGHFGPFWPFLTVFDNFSPFFFWKFLFRICFRSFWHQRIYDTTLGSRDIAMWRFLWLTDGRMDRGIGYSRSWMRSTEAERLAHRQ